MFGRIVGGIGRIFVRGGQMEMFVKRSINGNVRIVDIAGVGVGEVRMPRKRVIKGNVRIKVKGFV